ncbi:hypothetical protein [Chondromyces apiculatus]|uniref:hypothetical protein n=1 Tax=Chondromyces apiculatus TaxID=51 RepID=UPI0018CC33F1|nr:hypothetical protein [Chondromyces apiculatus]
MGTIRNLSVIWAVSLSCALAGCTVAVPEEGEADQPLAESAGEEGEEAMTEEAMTEDATSEVSSEIQSEPANAMGCHPNGNYCLARCNHSGTRLYSVGHFDTLSTGCLAASENFCLQVGQGYRTFWCRGYNH